MALPEEASAAEANQAGVTPSQVRQQRVAQVTKPPPPIMVSDDMPKIDEQLMSNRATSGPNYSNVGPGAAAGTTKGMDPTFAERLGALIAASGGRLKLVSGFRSHEEQQALWEKSDKTGRMVARPGHSNHERGIAGDLSGDLQWAHQHAPEFGLYFPMSWEPWHIEPVGSRSGKGAFSGPQATNRGYTKAPAGYESNPDPGAPETGGTSTPVEDPRKSVGYQLNNFMALLNDPEFILGGPAQLPSYFTSMPNGTA